MSPGGNVLSGGLRHDDELAYAGKHLTTIEINGTFYRTQSAASFRKWRDETPDNFMFSVKGHALIVNKKVLAEAGEGSTGSSTAASWNSARSSTVALAIRALQEIRRRRLRRVPEAPAEERDGQKLMHVVEVRHESFLVPEFVELLAPTTSPSSMRLRRLSGDGRRHRRLRLCATAADGREERHRYAPADIDRWRRSPRPGKPAARRTGSNASPKKPRRKRSGRFFST